MINLQPNSNKIISTPKQTQRVVHRRRKPLRGEPEWSEKFLRKNYDK